MNFGEFASGKAQQLLPPCLASHEAELNHFGVLCHELCVKLLRLFALGLQVCHCVRLLGFPMPDQTQIDPNSGGKDWFSSRHDPSQGSSGSVLRLRKHASQSIYSLSFLLLESLGTFKRWRHTICSSSMSSDPMIHFGREVLTQKSYSPCMCVPISTE